MIRGTSCHSPSEPILFASNGTDSWYVYMLSSQDCTTFKVGFSCNPLQRIYTFNRRFYEWFDLGQSLVLRVDTERQARAVESELKNLLAASRIDCPDWVSSDAGGDTEWFSAVEFVEGETFLRALAVDDAKRIVVADEYIRDRLRRMSGAFEFWASDYALRLQNDTESVSLGYARTVAVEPLRDWLDAYRYFTIPLFTDDAATLSFVVAGSKGYA